MSQRNSTLRSDAPFYSGNLIRGFEAAGIAQKAVRKPNP